MAKINGHFYLTSNQVKDLAKGRQAKIMREGKFIVLRMKTKDKQVEIWRRKIDELKTKIAKRIEANKTAQGHAEGQGR